MLPVSHPTAGPHRSARAVCCSAVDGASAYVSGELYRRELPGSFIVLDDHGLSPDIIVVDGDIHPGDMSTPDLEQHLYNAVDGRARIVGVAKRPLSGIGSRHAILRGGSSRPLYITAAGITFFRARECILSMHGGHRIPTLLNFADRKSRRHAAADALTEQGGFLSRATADWRAGRLLAMHDPIRCQRSSGI